MNMRPTILLHTGTTDAQLAEWVLDGIDVLTHGEPVSADHRAAIRAETRRARRPTVRWTSPARGVHMLDGNRLNSSLAGLDAALAAIAARGRGSVAAADFAAPGALRVDNSVRNSLKRAAALLTLINPALGREVAGIVVAKGMLQYTPTGKVDIVTE